MGSRDDFKKKKEIEEARKAGTMAPELDEDGKEINPHIPQYISQAPWYLDNANKPGLKHQRAQKKEDFDNKWYERGKKAGPAAKTYRKGACTNCGAMSHKVKDCVERPRKIGAKYTNSDIKPDEVVQSFQLDYDGKRDRWNGYDASNYKAVMNTYDHADEERRRIKSESFQASLQNSVTESDPDHARFPSMNDANKVADGALVNESDSESDNEAEAEEGFKEKTGFNNAPVQKVDPKTRTTIRNLRIREDTAKYLRNLDLNSAHYDPKTRSMRENPNPTANPNESLYAGDNFIRHTGDVSKFGTVQSYVWDAYEGGKDLHFQAAPSQAELFYKEDKQRKEVTSNRTKEQILAKYGGQEYMEAPPKELLLAQTEQYVEYSSSGKVIKGTERAVAKSKYTEDVYIGNHTSVWGSYWQNGEWGFACCKQVVKQSYCTGADGRAVRDEIVQEMTADVEEEDESEPKSLVDQHNQAMTKKQREKAAKEKQEKEQKEKEARLQRALQHEESQKGVVHEKDERKRKYNSMAHDDYKVTDEDMEAYNLKRIHADDPMKDYIGK